MNTPNDTKAPRVAFWLRAMEVRKHRLTHDYRKSLKDEATKGISDEDLATTERTLEQMARNLGWDESQTDEHFGPGRGRGFGPGFGPGGFGSGRDFRRALRRNAMMHGFGHQPHPEHHDHHGHDEHDEQGPAEEAPKA
jgi:hypothetical protein